MTDLTIATHNAGVPPAPPEAHQRAGIDPDDLAQVVDCLLCIEELLSNSGLEVQPERLASLLRLINNQLAQVMKGA